MPAPARPRHAGVVGDQQAEGQDAQPVEVGAAGDGHGAPRDEVSYLSFNPLIWLGIVTTGGISGTTGGATGTSGVLGGAPLQWRVFSDSSGPSASSRAHDHERARTRSVRKIMTSPAPA